MSLQLENLKFLIESAGNDQNKIGQLYIRFLDDLECLQYLILTYGTNYSYSNFPPLYYAIVYDQESSVQALLMG